MSADDRITELEEQLRRKDLAIEEMNHRFRNQLQIVSNLLDIQASRSTSKETIEALRQCRSRVASIAMVQDMLRVGQDAAVEMDQYLPALVSAIAAAWKGAGASVIARVEAEKLSLTPARAAVAGLVVTEFVTNAFKHAFAPDATGHINVGLTCSEGKVRLVIGDDGRGMPDGLSVAHATRGGLRLVKALVSQLKGKTEYAPGPGTTVTVTFPA
jgi:two-component sensor histidine kinase